MRTSLAERVPQRVSGPILFAVQLFLWRDNTFPGLSPFLFGLAPKAKSTTAAERKRTGVFLENRAAANRQQLLPKMCQTLCNFMSFGRNCYQVGMAQFSAKSSVMFKEEKSFDFIQRANINISCDPSGYCYHPIFPPSKPMHETHR